MEGGAGIANQLPSGAVDHHYPLLALLPATASVNQ
jgi:hypothetical protein